VKINETGKDEAAAAAQDSAPSAAAAGTCSTVGSNRTVLKEQKAAVAVR